ncbi:MAG TPA: phosphatase PAP2 family protein [Aquihabitans sp.]|nr:phosphatase PAP2 family protein [Aquihabitans sp.]
MVAVFAGASLWLYGRAIADEEAMASAAMANAAAIDRAERALGLDAVTDLGSSGLSRGVVGDAFAGAYALGYWPFLVLAAVVAWRRSRPAFWRFAVAMATSGLVGVAVMAAYPVAPPRLTGMVDVVAGSPWRPVAHPDGVFNPYGAMPSFHVGWSIVAGAALAAAASGRRARVGAWLQPVVMGVAVVVTANHWALDVVAGGALAVAAWCTAPALLRLVARHRAAAAATSTGARSAAAASGAAATGRGRPGPRPTGRPSPAPSAG